MNTLFLRLEGPLQSWGLRARWGERDTTDAPTKSGVIGLLGCALGLRRDDARLRDLSDNLRMGVRVDLPGILMRDYHTTGGGRYSTIASTGGPRYHDEPYIGGVLSAEVTKGRIKVKINQKTGEPETDVSERYYLADASFLVALQGSPDSIGELAAAVQSPVWTLFLGRKACVPSTPIFAGMGQFDILEEALKNLLLSPRVETAWQRSRPTHLRLLIETEPGAGNRQYDNIGTPSRRVFRARYVRETWLRLEDGPAPINTMEG
jgi:CRISPR system Cascade subunit CasD